MRDPVDIILDIYVKFERREDGGLRAFSDQMPELVLSSKNAAGLLEDIPVVIKEVLRSKYNASVQVKRMKDGFELLSLPAANDQRAVLEPAIFQARTAA